MKFKKHVSFIASALVVGAFVGCLGGFAATQSSPQRSASQKADAWIAQQEALLASPSPQVAAPPPGLYERAYAVASEEQKQALDQLLSDLPIDLPGQWQRPVLLVMGELSADTPRLSAEKAEEIYLSREPSQWAQALDEIAGAPDFVGGSGIARSVYYLNDQHTEAIVLTLGDMFHTLYAPDGAETILPFSTQALDSAPLSDRDAGVPTAYPSATPAPRP